MCINMIDLMYLLLAMFHSVFCCHFFVFAKVLRHATLLLQLLYYFIFMVVWFNWTSFFPTIETDFVYYRFSVPTDEVTAAQLLYSQPSDDYEVSSDDGDEMDSKFRRSFYMFARLVSLPF